MAPRQSCSWTPRRQETLDSLQRIPDISWAAFLLLNGQELVSYQRGRVEASTEKVVVEGIGEPCVPLSQRLASQSAFGVLAAALALSSSLALSRRMASSIVPPLLSLVRLTEQVLVKLDFSLRAIVHRSGNDEGAASTT